MQRVWLRLAGVSIVVLAVTGCGEDAATVKGRVTYEGQAVEEGMINFLPAEGNGAITGGPIVNGDYEVGNVPPGKKIVEIIGVKSVPFARSSAEMAAMHEANKAKGDGSGIIDRADTVPADATGNNQEIEITSGEHVHDFKLSKPGQAEAEPK